MEDLERLLEQFRPVGPPDELRDKVMGMALRHDADSRGANIPFARVAVAWLPAAAALIVVIALYGLGARARGNAIPPTEGGDAAMSDGRSVELMTNRADQDDNIRTALEYVADLEDQWARADAERYRPPDTNQVDRE